MKLFASLYLDEDVSVVVARLLNARGFDATTTLEQGALGATDAGQIERSVGLGRCLLTHNRVDFETVHTNCVAAGRHHCGIIIASRRDPYEIARRVARLLDSLTAEEIENKLFFL